MRCDLRDGLLAALVIIVVALGARTAHLMGSHGEEIATLHRRLAHLREAPAEPLDTAPLGGEDFDGLMRRALQGGEEEDEERGEQCYTAAEVTVLALRAIDTVAKRHGAMVAQVDGLASALADKIDAEAAQLEVDAKADSPEMAALLARKVELRGVTALQGAVSGKASVNDSAALEADANADIEALWARLALKSNASTVEEIMGQLDATVEELANGTNLTLAMVTSAVVPLLDAKADAAALELIRTMLTDKVNASVVADLEAAWAATLPSPLATETRACRCAACADVPVGAALCSPWGELVPCACTNSSEARQAFPMSLPDRPCCRDASDTSCTACEVVAGYDGLEPAALSEALGSRAAGKFALAVSGTAPLTALMTFLTLYEGQSLVITGEPQPPGLGYFVTNVSGTWEEAKAACEAHNPTAILAVALSQAEMDAQSALISASVWGDVEYWVGYTLPRNRQPNNRPQNYDGENGHTMEGNGFEKWAPAGDHGSPRNWDRCVHAKANNDGWFMATCSGPRPGVCQLGVRQPPPPSGQLPSLDATITVKRGAEVVLNGSYVTGAITLEEGARQRLTPCGDGVNDTWLGEQCDNGLANANAPDVCRADCTRPRCGDGIWDSGENCDEGDANGADGTCGADCEPTCSCPDPSLPTGATVVYTGSYPLCGSRVAAYTCEVGPLQGGDATRLCLADGSWNGSAPTHCGCPVLTEPTYEKAPETIGITYSRGQAVGSVATYACDAGQGPLQGGDAVRSCGADGQWSGDAPTHCGCPRVPPLCNELVAVLVGRTLLNPPGTGNSNCNRVQSEAECVRSARGHRDYSVSLCTWVEMDNASLSHCDVENTRHSCDGVPDSKVPPLRSIIYYGCPGGTCGITGATSAGSNAIYTCHSSEHSLVFHEDPLPWHDAKAVCEAQGGGLAVLNTEAKNARALQLMFDATGNDNSAAWFGAEDLDNNGTFHWPGGSERLYSRPDLWPDALPEYLSVPTNGTSVALDFEDWMPSPPSLFCNRSGDRVEYDCTEQMLQWAQDSMAITQDHHWPHGGPGSHAACAELCCGDANCNQWDYDSANDDCFLSGARLADSNELRTYGPSPHIFTGPTHQGNWDPALSYTSCDVPTTPDDARCGIITGADRDGRRRWKAWRCNDTDVALSFFCDAGVGTVERVCQADGTWSGTTPDQCGAPSYCHAGLGDNWIEYKGHFYRTLDDAPADEGMGSPPNDGCQCNAPDHNCPDNYLPVPPGFQLAPNDADSVAVVRDHAWSTQCTVLADGYSVRGADLNDAGQSCGGGILRSVSRGAIEQLVETLPSSLVGYWPLGSEHNGSDVSGNGLDASVVNVQFVAGVWGSAWFLDGQVRVGDDDRSAIIIPDPGTDSPLDVRLVTMLAWVKPADPYNPPGDRGIIMNKEHQYEFGVCNPSHSGSGNCGGVTTLQSAFGPCWSWRGTHAVPAGEWSHVGAGFTGDGRTFFANGTEVETGAMGCPNGRYIGDAASPSNRRHNDHPLKIGARSPSGARPPNAWTAGVGHSSQFHGSVDEAMLFGTALVEAQVAAVYGKTAAPPPAPPQPTINSNPGISSQAECEAAATAAGLALGGGGWPFAGSYTTAGCYTYVTGNYVGMAFWGTRSSGQLYKSSHGQRAWVPALGDLVQRADDSSYSVGSCYRRVLVRCP